MLVYLIKNQASFFDGDIMPTYEKGNSDKHSFSGKRIKRGLYQTKDGSLINADVNGALNIIIKAVPDAFKLKDRGFLQTIRRIG